MYTKSKILRLSVLILTGTTLHAATVPVGSASYTTTFPGVDEAGRNGYPGGSPQLSGNAVGRPQISALIRSGTIWVNQSREMAKQTSCSIPAVRCTRSIR